MKITILLRHVVIDEKTKAIIEKKIAKIDKFFDDSLCLFVDYNVS